MFDCPARMNTLSFWAKQFEVSKHIITVAVTIALGLMVIIISWLKLYSLRSA